MAENRKTAELKISFFPQLLQKKVSTKLEWCFALVAQRLEQQTHNLLVVGSNPTEGIQLDILRNS